MQLITVAYVNVYERTSTQLYYLLTDTGVDERARATYYRHRCEGGDFFNTVDHWIARPTKLVRHVLECSLPTTIKESRNNRIIVVN